VLDALPAGLRGVTVEIAETLAPQVLIANHTAQTLTILDDAGRAFVRIGPTGVSADLNAGAWYKSLSTAYVPEPAAARDPHSPARWTQVDTGQSFGWFDPRLAVGPHAPTGAMRAADVAASTGTWRIPARMGAQQADITGHFRYEPPADGAYVTRLVTPAGFPPGIQFKVSQGSIPAILLMDTARRDIVLLGLDGEDEVRIGGSGVSINTRSRTWREWGQEERAGLDAGSAGWLPASRGAAYLWLEPRGRTDATSASHPDVAWKLPLRVDGVGYVVQGIASWKTTEHKELAAR
jgi:hypothetical protein